jgi:hypothetical protein
MADRLERFGLLCGAVAAVAWFVAVALLESVGNPADPDSGGVIADFYRDERGGILAAATLHGLGGFLFLWFVASTRAVLAASGSPRWLASAVVVGGTAGGALMLGLTAGQSTGATTDTELLSPDVAIVFWRLAHGFFVGAELALALFVAALSVAALRGLVLPRWLGWVGIAIALVLLIPPIGWLALLLLLPVWLFVASVLLFRNSAPRASAPAPTS